MDLIEEGKRVFDIEIEALKRTRDAIDDTFLEILNLITNCKGKVIITGMGKPGHVAKKLAATFSSLGTSSFCLHPAEALHGDLGMISENDVVIAISYSGESEEVTRMLPNIKMIGAKIVAISGNKNSTLVKYSDIAQIFPKFEEACYLGLAPTSSTTATMCYGDALAVVASAVYGFKKLDFGKLHPAGSLGKKLLIKVSDIMMHGDDFNTVTKDMPLEEAMLYMGKSLGAVCIADRDKLCGIFTDGDLRRILSKHVDIYAKKIGEVMTENCYVCQSDMLAVEALSLMTQYHISALPVVDEDVLKGVIHLKNITSSGIVL